MTAAERIDNAEFSALVIAERIGIPLIVWPGNCYGIAQACLRAKVVQGQLSYGFYWGPMVGRRFRGRHFTHHAWVELPDGRVWDPTRWVFEDTEPYVYVGPAGTDYDFGGNRLLELTYEEPPTPGGAQWRLRLSASARRDLGTLLKVGRWNGAVNNEQVFWLGNLSLRLLGRHARPVYRELIRIGRGAVIPIDNRERILGEEKR